MSRDLFADQNNPSAGEVNSPLTMYGAWGLTGRRSGSGSSYNLPMRPEKVAPQLRSCRSSGGNRGVAADPGPSRVTSFAQVPFEHAHGSRLRHRWSIGQAEGCRGDPALAMDVSVGTRYRPLPVKSWVTKPSQS